ncbi:MAG: hypothetical protein Kow0074_14950 [Candidatus Zixiibacteriota bacterium]
MRSVVSFVLSVLLLSIPASAEVIDGQDPVAAAAHQQFLQKSIVARWIVTDKNALQTAHAREIDVLEEAPDLSKGYFTIFVTQDQLDDLRADGYQIEVLNYNWYESFNRQAASANGGFRTLLDAIVFMDSISTQYPAIASPKFSIGQSVNGLDIWAMKISDNWGTDENEPEFLFTGMHHAREPIGLEVNLETIRTLVEGYGIDPRITQLVDEREIWFIPCLNPDGYEYNTSNFPAGGGMWRKNRRNNGNGTFGVDLNRNYGHEWGYDNNGSSPSSSSETYRGTAPFSEPETQAIRAFVNSRQFVFAVNFHSYSDLYLWPWGYDYIYTPDQVLFEAIGDSLSTYNGYTPQVGWALYPTNGDSDDWMYGATGEHQKILSFTPEVGSSAQGFWPPEADIPGLIAENIEPNLIWIELASDPNRIFPPAMPTWTTPDTVTVADFDLTWSDPGGSNAAVSYSLYQLEGPFVKTDDVESALVTDWSLDGFTRSTARSASPTHSYYSGATNASRKRMTGTEYYLVQPGDSLIFKTWYDIETGWDYAYAEISTDGGQTFATLPGNVTTNTNPNGNNRGNGITGASNGWTTAKFALSAYEGQYVIFRISYETDQAVLEEGIYVDDIGPLQSYTTTTTLLTDSPSASYSITGATNGDYLYRVASKDQDDQVSPLGIPNALTVAIALNGDMDGNESIDAVDVNLLIDFVFYDGPGAAVPGAEECNGIAGINVLDIVRLIDYVYRGGPAPIAVQ